LISAGPNAKLMMYKLQIEQDTDTCIKQMEKGNFGLLCLTVCALINYSSCNHTDFITENSETVLKDLRSLCKELSDTDWQFDSIGKVDST
jgi:hypothetical protein